MIRPYNTDLPQREGPTPEPQDRSPRDRRAQGGRPFKSSGLYEGKQIYLAAA